jgi:tRNA uridine 5-carboxymethylaminomethyl modification enzyme
MRRLNFDAVVIGGGHSGIEASYILSKAGFSVALVTQKKDFIGRMSCNPSIGGVGKGHLVREIDALGGLMAKVADKTGIQFRILNSSKGAAVQGLRCQSDRKRYSQEAIMALSAFKNLEIIEGEAASIEASSSVKGVWLEDGTFLKTKYAVIAAGTFLRGKLFTGMSVKEGGRIGEPPSKSLSISLEKLGIPLSRLKTGTPARLKRDSINYEILEKQEGDKIPEPFSLFSSPFPVLPQECCHITYTTNRTKEVVHKYLDKSPLFQGLIKGVGPRYCPSLEDKIVKFPHHERHQVFIEPDGADSDLVYPNGISTSLPVEAQDEFIRTIPGLEEAEVVTYGYAVEYDFLQPTNLTFDLSLRGIEGLYFAGQVIGTTGYEEAAGLGLYAAYNIIKKLNGKEPFRLQRSESYLGVMVEDLVLKGVLEPYRLFTSRAEYRMLLDRHTAYRRLSKYAEEENLISENEKLLRDEWENTFNKWAQTLKKSKTKGGTCFDAVKRESSLDDSLLNRFPIDNPFMKNYLFSEIRNEGYRKRFADEARKLETALCVKIPKDFDYKKISGLSREMVERLSAAKPETLLSASRIPGVTPAALSLLRIEIEKRRKK